MSQVIACEIVKVAF